MSLKDGVFSTVADEKHGAPQRATAGAPWLARSGGWRSFAGDISAGGTRTVKPCEARGAGEILRCIPLQTADPSGRPCFVLSRHVSGAVTHGWMSCCDEACHSMDVDDAFSCHASA